MIKVCEICGKKFVVTNRNRRKKVCSLACRTQKHRMATIRSDIKTALRELRLEAHGNRIASHYAHAKDKHPYFCDWMHKKASKSSRTAVEWSLEQSRKWVNSRIAGNCVGWNDILECEVWEVLDALYKGDKAQAVEELYDCIAVCLRAIDVLEGRQKLGKPKTIFGNNAEK